MLRPVIVVPLIALATLGRNGSAIAATVVKNVSSVSALYSAFQSADSDTANTYEIRLAPGTYTLNRPASGDPGDKNNRTAGCLKLKGGHVVLIGAGNNEIGASSYAIDGGWDGSNRSASSILCIEAFSAGFKPSVEVRGVKMLNAYSGANRGAIDLNGGVLTLSYVYMVHNKRASGPGATLQALRSTVTINRSYFDVAMLQNFLTPASCGGVNNDGGHFWLSNTTTRISESTISGGGACRGGGIYNEGATGNTLYMENSTILGNRAIFNGGGLELHGGGRVTLWFNTIAGNASGVFSSSDPNGRYGGGIAFNGFTGTLLMKGNILAANVALNQALNGVPGRNDGDDCYIENGSAFSSSVDYYMNVLGKPGNCGFVPVGRLSGTNSAPLDPRLGQPGDLFMQWPGFVKMHESLVAGSVAIGAFVPSATRGTCLFEDQRGVARGGCDIGAYQTSCQHDLCATGTAMNAACDLQAVDGGSCTPLICDADPFCCNSGWDDLCVQEVGSICGVTCP